MIMTQPEPFRWLRHPEAEAYLLEHFYEFLATMPRVRTFARILLERTGSPLFDWLDHVVLADGHLPQSQLGALGFQPEEVPTEPGSRVYHHPGTIFPRVVLRHETDAPPGTTVGVAMQVEDVGHFLMANKSGRRVSSMPPVESKDSVGAGSSRRDKPAYAPYRRARIWQRAGREFWVIERRGYAGFIPVEATPDSPRPILTVDDYLSAFERWATRPRIFVNDRAGMEHTLKLARSLVSEMGTDTAAWIAFSAERAYWQGRNRAGQVQRARQDSLGLGWANHDHHTFRSSREVFPLLIQILETFGFRPRERFYAGAEAGWGAQVMEQPVCRFAVFADVDLSPDEVEGDFAHSPLAPRQKLDTVGLWCALHGESMLNAGLHHVAGRFDFDAIRDQLAESGVEMMRPFSDFPYLRQAFTRGEQWQVAPDRLERLAASGQIDDAQRARFVEKGAIGSHLENIQRGEGFKGFNQQRVSDIIRRTDPRRESGAA
jgi:hypothetical protein